MTFSPRYIGSFVSSSGSGEAAGYPLAAALSRPVPVSDTRAVRVSVALAACEGQRFLDEQLESIARQSRLPDELVLQDDASTDETLEIARAFAARAPFPVTVDVNPQRLGITGNFGQALARTTGWMVVTVKTCSKAVMARTHCLAATTMTT